MMEGKWIGVEEKEALNHLASLLADIDAYFINELDQIKSPAHRAVVQDAIRLHQDLLSELDQLIVSQGGELELSKENSLRWIRLLKGIKESAEVQQLFWETRRYLQERYTEYLEKFDDSAIKPLLLDQQSRLIKSGVNSALNRS